MLKFNLFIFFKSNFIGFCRHWFKPTFMIYYTELLIYNCRDYFPPTIIYEAYTEKVENWYYKLNNQKNCLFD